VILVTFLPLIGVACVIGTFGIGERSMFVNVLVWNS